MNQTNILSIFLIVFLTGVYSMKAQETIKIDATITSIETKISGRNTYDVAEITFTTEAGDTIASEVRLYGFPFLGSFKKVGDTVEITYQKDNPYLIQTVSRGFLQQYAWHILIAIVVLFLAYRFIKK